MNSAPPANERMFQGALRLGGESPFGDVFGDQFGLLLEGGFKITRSNFLGGYLGGGIGSVGSALTAKCPLGEKCSGLTFSTHFGAEFQHSFLPGERLNPWLGIGLGYVQSRAAIDREGLRPVHAVTYGFEARLTWGLDIRESATLAMGPFVDALYGPSNGELRDGTTSKLPKDVGASFLIGWRLVLFP